MMERGIDFLMMVIFVMIILILYFTLREKLRNFMFNFDDVFKFKQPIDDIFKPSDELKILYENIDIGDNGLKVNFNKENVLKLDKTGKILIGEYESVQDGDELKFKKIKK